MVGVVVHLGIGVPGLLFLARGSTLRVLAGVLGQNTAAAMFCATIAPVRQCVCPDDTARG
jgi:hypothetical protein